MARSRRADATALPAWIKPQLTKLVDAPPDGPEWLHEIKFDGYRMHLRLDRGAVRLLTRTGLDWARKYPAIASAVASLPARQAYLDGELCGVRPDGTTSFSLIQNASDTGNRCGIDVDAVAGWLGSYGGEEAGTCETPASGGGCSGER